MRSNRRRVLASYEEDEADCSGGEDLEWQPTAAVAAPGRASWRASGDDDGEPTCSAAAAAATDSGEQHQIPAGLEEWEEEQLLATLSPESQKRERRRIANRDCARRIRQRKTVRAGALSAGRDGELPCACLQHS